jgi:xylulokinase
MASSFAVARLTGEWILDHHSASQCDPLYELAANDWNREWAELVAPGLPLPRLLWPAEVAGTVHAAGAAATGIPEGTPVIAGTVDAWAEAVSVGVRRPGELMLMYGSTLFLVLGSEAPVGHPSLWTTCGVDAGSWSVAAGLATGGALIDWIRGVAGADDHAGLIAEAARVPAGADGLVVLPYFAGERTPILDPDARGTIVGLTLAHGPAALYRATVEGIAYAVRHNLEAMGTPGGRVVAVGGGTSSELWLQAVSDATGLRQEVPEVALGASYGDALLAAEAVGLAPAGSSWVVTQRVVEPDPAARATYNELYAHYRALYPATQTVQHALARLQHETTGG